MWSYTFTDYENFEVDANAITPRPNWTDEQTDQWDIDVSVSTTPPLQETDYNAMEFSLWKKFGREFLIKSNINNWLVCSPDKGSLVDWLNGGVNCKIVKRVTDTCSDAPPPSSLRSVGYCGPSLKADKIYYYFDGCTEKASPIHDPCGQNTNNGLKNVKNPHGNIFVR